MPDPLYIPANCNPAYQLRWSLSLFATSVLPAASEWFEPLQLAVEADGVRALEHRFRPPHVWQFLLSTKPHVTPPQIVKCVKGRLQHALQATHPRAFRRNFSLVSIGDARREVVEAYVAGQLGHHRMADAKIQERLTEFQLQLPEVDLAEPRMSSHGRYLYNLHVVLVHEDGYSEVREKRLALTRDTLIRIARKKEHRLSRASVLADHLHFSIGCGVKESPEVVALGYLNNLASAHGMRPIFRFGYYIGTFGEYDMGAIWRAP